MSRLLAIAASFRPHSLNRRLLALAVPLAEEAGARVRVLDYAPLDAPTYRGEPASAMPAPVAQLAEALRGHDGLILAVPEYNGSIPGGFKNILDWLSVAARAPLEGKTALLMCASPSLRGGMSGLQALRVPLAAMGCWVYPHAVGIGRAQEQLGGPALANAADQQHLIDCIRDFVRSTGALHA